MILITVSCLLKRKEMMNKCRIHLRNTISMNVCITDDEESVIGKLKQVAIDRLKEEGVEIDSEDPEKTKKSIIQRAKAYFGVSRKSSTTLAVFLITFFFGLIDTK